MYYKLINNRTIVYMQTHAIVSCHRKAMMPRLQPKNVSPADRKASCIYSLRSGGSNTPIKVDSLNGTYKDRCTRQVYVIKIFSMLVYGCWLGSLYSWHQNFIAKLTIWKPCSGSAQPFEVMDTYIHRAARLLHFSSISCRCLFSPSVNNNLVVCVDANAIIDCNSKSIATTTQI